MGSVHQTDPPTVFFKVGYDAKNFKKTRPYHFGPAYWAYILHGTDRASQTGFGLTH